MIALKNNKLTVKDYNYLREKVGWRTYTEIQGEIAINNSLYIISAYYNDKLVGMGRLVGDGAVICYVQDLIITPECQGLGIGTKILKGLEAYVNSIQQDNTTMMFCLMSAKGREEFYNKNGFITRPTDELGPGMIKYKTKC